ncbi:N-acetylmuramoyl-L-alanine amidase family protein [Flavitalea flava]
MMIKKITTLLIFSGIVCTITSFNVRPTPKQKSALRTIVIDPGHGGFDPGTHGLISKEKDIALDISLKLGKAIQEEYPDVKLVFTRTTDIMPGNKPTIKEGLNYRAELANKSHGDLFICIHGNSDGHAAGHYQARRLIGHKWAGKGKRRRKVPIYETYNVKNTRIGTGTYIWKADRNGDKGAAINQNDENMGDDIGDSTNTAFDMSSPEARIRAQLYEKKYFANSALFATLVEDEFVKAGRKSDGVMQRDVGIRVLQATGMPSVLIETGFLTNKEEEEYLNSDDGQAEIVRNILDALKRYKDNLEGVRPAGGTSSLKPVSPSAAKFTTAYKEKGTPKGFRKRILAN